MMNLDGNSGGLVYVIFRHFFEESEGKHEIPRLGYVAPLRRFQPNFHSKTPEPCYNTSVFGPATAVLVQYQFRSLGLGFVT